MYIDNKFVSKYDGLINDRIKKASLPPQLHDTIKAKIYERILSSNNYDPNKSKLTTWLWKICASVISNEKVNLSRSKDIMDHEYLSIDQVTNLIGQEDAGDTLDEIDRIFKATVLSSRDKKIVRMYYLEEWTAKELSLMFGLEVRNVEKIIERAMKALRQTAEA